MAVVDTGMSKSMTAVGAVVTPIMSRLNLLKIVAVVVAGMNTLNLHPRVVAVVILTQTPRRMKLIPAGAAGSAHPDVCMLCWVGC